MIDIIIPTFNQDTFTIQCLKSIKRSTHQNYRIVWVDNGSTYRSRKNVLIELSDHNYLSIWLPDRVGFIQAVNIALRECRGEYVVILNNDTEVTSGWLDLLLLPLKNCNKIVASGPLTTAGTSHQDIQRMQQQLPELKQIAGINLININSLQNALYETFGSQFFVEMDQLAFFCTTFKRSIFDEVGLLDKRFGEGFSDDADFSIRVRKLGYKLALVPAAYVEHYHQQTFLSIYTKKEASVILHRNRKILEHKWDGIYGK